MSLCNMRRCCRCYEIKPLCSNIDFQTPRDVPTCDFWKREGLLTWTTGEDSGHSDSDCEEQEACSYKVKQNNSSMKCHTSSPSGCLIVSAPRSRLRLPHLHCSRLKSETLINPPVRLSNFHTASQWSHNRPV